MTLYWIKNSENPRAHAHIAQISDHTFCAIIISRKKFQNFSNTLTIQIRLLLFQFIGEIFPFSLFLCSFPCFVSCSSNPSVAGVVLSGLDLRRPGCCLASLPSTRHFVLSLRWFEQDLFRTYRYFLRRF